MMTKKHALSTEEQALFRQTVIGVREWIQDTLAPAPLKKTTVHQAEKRIFTEQKNASHYFSDEFQPLLPQEGPMRYLRSGVSADELKKLRRGDYAPDIILDVHGLTQKQARDELGALIATCQREGLFCASVMHGHGKQILKQQIPLWLAQHPQVMAFHQAPKCYGANAALLMLIEAEE
ncbi:MAG: Endonuclease MutS2 [Candidatus Erwinia impunctatus]|nr:Endonuclease MutS2 [Culicoides impunctatus]